jgi:outer membrane protein assembly factor BamD (BamD/ComL family)
MTGAPKARFAPPQSDQAAPVPTFHDSAVISSPIDADTLAAEVKSIDSARSALAAGKAAQALAVLDDYERLFRKRGFAPEALYLRMEACAALGRTAEARVAAERLLASYPNSLHSARARAVLSKNP